MKVILLKDVPSLGKKYDVKTVSDGHALNFLIPNNLVQKADEAQIKKVEALKAQESERRKKHEEALSKILASLDKMVIEIEAKASAKGHLFAGVHKEEIAPEISKRIGMEIPQDYIILDKPIKEVGEQIVEIKVGDKSAKIKIVVKSS
jgi:large subunit ribosomal protein L9